MSSFRGSYLYVVDEKGRVSLPAKLRKSISPEANENFIIIRGFEKCLFVYPMDEWNKIEQNLRNLSRYEPEHRFFLRMMLEHVAECQLDAQARISIPQELREYASLRDEVRIIGTLDKIEIWDPQTYEDYKKSYKDSYESIAARIMK